MSIISKKTKIFTWHIHGSYLYYLSQGNYEIYIPVDQEHSQGYVGRGKTFPFGPNVHEVPANEVGSMDFDCILFQSAKNYVTDQYEVLSEEQRNLPKIFLEHDPPRENPTNTQHIVDDAEIKLVHVTHFNKLMWDNNRTPAYVIDHGVMPTEIEYSGELERGVVMVNNLSKRGRRLGLDIFMDMRKNLPLDLIGMGSKELGGMGEIPFTKLPEFLGRYRFFLNPIRYTSLGLSVLEAMMLGMPIVGLATTEMPTAIENGVSGYLHTDIDELNESCELLLKDKALAFQLGKQAKKKAMERFNIARFTTDWEQLFQASISKTSRLSAV